MIISVYVKYVVAFDISDWIERMHIIAISNPRKSSIIDGILTPIVTKYIGNHTGHEYQKHMRVFYQ